MPEIFVFLERVVSGGFSLVNNIGSVLFPFSILVDIFAGYSTQVGSSLSETEICYSKSFRLLKFHLSDLVLF